MYKGNGCLFVTVEELHALRNRGLIEYDSGRGEHVTGLKLIVLRPEPRGLTLWQRFVVWLSAKLGL